MVNPHLTEAEFKGLEFKVRRRRRGGKVIPWVTFPRHKPIMSPYATISAGNYSQIRVGGHKITLHSLAWRIANRGALIPPTLEVSHLVNILGDTPGNAYYYSGRNINGTALLVSLTWRLEADFDN